MWKEKKRLGGNGLDEACLTSMRSFIIAEPSNCDFNIFFRGEPSNCSVKSKTREGRVECHNAKMKISSLWFFQSRNFGKKILSCFLQIVFSKHNKTLRLYGRWTPSKLVCPLSLGIIFALGNYLTFVILLGWFCQSSVIAIPWFGLLHLNLNFLIQFWSNLD